MNSALLVLLRLRWQAGLRRIFRSLRTLRGAIFSLLGLAMVAMWLGPSLLLTGFAGRPDPELVVAFASSGTFLMCLIALLPSGGKGAAYFSPAEIDFLFAGPFTRRALLAYKLGSTAVGWALGSLLFSVSFLPFLPWWPSGYVGTLLIFLFVQLFAMVVALGRQTIAERAYTRARQVVLLLLGVAVAGGVWKLWIEASLLAGERPTDLFALVRLFRASWLGSLLAPFDLFGWAVAARTLRELAYWGGLALMANLALAALVLWLDARWEEATLVASQRAYERLEQIRRGGAAWVFAPRARGGRRLPMLPWLGGAGPIAWRQLTSVARSPWTLVAMMFLILLMVGPALLMGRSAADPVLVLVTGVWLSMFLQCDFRGDVDHFPWLKMLPLRPVAVAAGELAAPTLLTTMFQFLVLGLMAALAEDTKTHLITAAFALPINVLLFGGQNLLFLLFPARMAPATAGDLQHIGRMMVLWLLELIALLTLGGVAALMGLIAGWLAGWSWTVALAAAWGVLILEAGATIPAIAWAYSRFDVSLHTPP